MFTLYACEANAIGFYEVGWQEREQITKQVEIPCWGVWRQKVTWLSTIPLGSGLKRFSRECAADAVPSACSHLLEVQQHIVLGEI